MKSYPFDIAQVLYKLNHYLPSQTPLRDFILHNLLHSSLCLKFYEAIFRASKIFGYQVNVNLEGYRKLYQKKRISDSVLDQVLKARKSSAEVAVWKQKLLQQDYSATVKPQIGDLRAQWKTLHGIDLDNEVQPLLFRILCDYLGSSMAFYTFPVEDNGLLNSISKLERTSLSGFFKSKRVKQLLLTEGECTVENLLHLIVGKAAYFEQYLFEQQLSHHGWSCILTTNEDNPDAALPSKKLSLKEVILLELLLEIDHLDILLGENWQPLAMQIAVPPLDLFTKLKDSEYAEVLSLWQDAYEWSYYAELISDFKKVETTKVDVISIHSYYLN